MPILVDDFANFIWFFAFRVAIGEKGFGEVELRVKENPSEQDIDIKIINKEMEHLGKILFPAIIDLTTTFLFFF